MNTLSNKGEAQFEPESPISKKTSPANHQAFDQLQLQQQQQRQIQQEMANDISKTGPSQNQSVVKAHHEKVLKLPRLTVNLPVFSLPISPELRKKVVSLLLL